MKYLKLYESYNQNKEDIEYVMQDLVDEYDFKSTDELFSYMTKNAKFISVYKSNYGIKLNMNFFHFLQKLSKKLKKIGIDMYLNIDNSSFSNVMITHYNIGEENTQFDNELSIMVAGHYGFYYMDAITDELLHDMFHSKYFELNYNPIVTIGLAVRKPKSNLLTKIKKFFK